MQFSARDLPAHTKLKTRQIGQGTTSELQFRDLKGELVERERKYEEEKGKDVDFAQQKIMRLKDNKTLLLKGSEEWENRAKGVRDKYDDADDDACERRNEGDDSDDEDDDEDSDGDNSEDDEEELMRELEKIKKEREEERLRKEQLEREEEDMRRKQEILAGNPLTQAAAGVAQAPSGSAAIKRKWNDDVVFKNQSRNEPDVKKRFINDTIRNDFHRRFLKTYIQ